VSRLLQRLTGQARGAGGPRIRPAAAMRAQVPIAFAPREPNGAIDASTALESAPRSDAGGFLNRPASHEGPRQPSNVVSPQAMPTVATTRDPEMPFAAAPPVVDRGATAPLPPPFLVPDIIVAPPAPTAIAPIRPAAAAIITPIRPAVTREARTDASGDPTEVHVHIGRIEVTALPAPTASIPARRERTARPRVPLSDYLAKRRSP
jgi:hypothetical protein